MHLPGDNASVGIDPRYQARCSLKQYLEFLLIGVTLRYWLTPISFAMTSDEQ
jgi:hypothetical protein